MTSRARLCLFFVFCLPLLGACGREAPAPQEAAEPAAAATAAAQASEQRAAALADALSATYPAHAARSKVVDWEGNVLQEGDNGFVCMPTPPIFAERGAAAPMCLDAVWMAWAAAWQNQEPFKTDRIGIAYMLAGDGGASNIDPYATEETPDNQWIVEGPHLMVISPDPALLAHIPTDPSYGGPYVMWRGTEYEHVMVPVKIPGADGEGPLADALSAVDSAMQDGVRVMDWSGKTLQEGDSIFTCMPTPPALTVGRAPMCFDEVWMAWGNAWQNKQPFSADKIGFSYMLAGDEGASNVDPFATEATADNQWIVESPHMMIIAPDPAMLGGITRDPSRGGPYVMWDGTDYAHVMVPVADRE